MLACSTSSTGWGTSVQACADRELQVPESGYSPPCYSYTGTDNGGATTPGVDADSVTVSYRITEQDLLVLLGQLPPLLASLGGDAPLYLLRL